MSNTRNVPSLKVLSRKYVIERISFVEIHRMSKAMFFLFQILFLEHYFQRLC